MTEKDSASQLINRISHYSCKNPKHTNDGHLHLIGRLMTTMRIISCRGWELENHVFSEHVTVFEEICWAGWCMCSISAFCMFMWGVTSLSSQRSLMPLDPGRRLDGITGNWIVFHLLWKQPRRHTPPSSTLPTAIPAVSYHCISPSPSLVHPCSHPIMEACRTEPLLLHVIQSFPLRCRNAGLDVSRVLNKAAACTIAAAEIQYCVVYHPNGVEQYA